MVPKMLSPVVVAALLVALLAPAQADPAAPTSRQKAVAIDAITLAPTESADLEQLATGLQRPWSLAFAPGGDILITEKYRGLRVMRDGVLLPDVLPGGPTNVFAKEDSGILDVALDPDFANNRTIYLAFAEGDEKANHTSVWKGRYDGHRLTDGRVVFRSHPDKAGPSHPGGRLLFLPDHTFLLTIGDGFDYKTAAQDLGSDLGKIVRLSRDGTPPSDNPFIGRAGVLSEIWTSGHRNPQGLTRDPVTGEIWEHEHGPRGGDEINLLHAGGNYGWPLLTHGIDYDGTIISDRTAAPGMERSAFYWAPSIAPSGLAFYRGTAFPDWNGKMFVGALAAKAIVRIRRGKDTSFLVEDERMFVPLKKRIRDIRESPDGLLYVLTDEENGALLRIRPKANAQQP